MGSAYYYFIASLPLISLDGKMPVTVEAFRQECQRLLSAQDNALMEKIWVLEGISSRTGNHLLDTWTRFEHALRNELTWHRADRLDKDPLQYLRGPRSLEPGYAEEINRLFKMEDLRGAEKILNKLKWRFLEDLAAGHYFDIEFLLVYALQLKMLERSQEYGSPAGRDFLQGIKTMPLPESCVMAKAG